MRRILVVVTALGTAAVVALAAWRRHPRVGAEYVNRVVDPWLMHHGIIERTNAELGLLEHVGRRSGTVRITPIRPVPTEGGFRIIVPLGVQSHWAQNVLAAGHCRIEVGSWVHELDEPRLVSASEIAEVPAVIGQLLDWLGFRYLVLHGFDRYPGALSTPARRADATTTVAETSAADPLGVSVTNAEFAATAR